MSLVSYYVASSVLQKYYNQLMSIPGVVAVGTECEEGITDRCYIAVLVESEDVIPRIPRQLNGVLVKTRVVGKIGILR